MPAQPKCSSKVAFCYSFLDKLKRIYCFISILVRREQKKYLIFFRLKTAVNYGKVKRQAGAEVSRFAVSSSEEDITENTKHLSAP